MEMEAEQEGNDIGGQGVANDLIGNGEDWVQALLGWLDKSMDEFNAGKFRGAVFQMNFLASESRKMQVRSTNAGAAMFDHSTTVQDSFRSNDMRGGVKSQMMRDSLLMGQQFVVKSSNNNPVESGNLNNNGRTAVTGGTQTLVRSVDYGSLGDQQLQNQQLLSSN